MATRKIISFVTAMAFFGCGGGTPPADAPDPSATAPTSEAPSDIGKSEAPSDPDPAKAEEPKKEEPKTAAKIEKPKSESTLGGASVSEVDSAALQAEVKKLGWIKDNVAAAGGVTGSYESIKIDIEKGKNKGYIELMRPAASPGPATGTAAAPPSEQKGNKEKEGAAVWYDEASDVLVVVMVEGKTADAKKLLTQLVKAAKKAPATAKKPEKAPASEGGEKKSAAAPEKKAPAPAPAK